MSLLVTLEDSRVRGIFEGGERGVEMGVAAAVVTAVSLLPLPGASIFRSHAYLFSHTLSFSLTQSLAHTRIITVHSATRGFGIQYLT